MTSRSTTKVALAAAAAGSLLLLTACGGDTKPAAGSDSGSGSGSGSSSKTIVFSPIGLQIPAMQQLSEGVKGYGSSKGYTVQVQDPNLDPQKQATDLDSVISSGKVGGAWVISVAPAAIGPVVKTALDKQVAMLLNGVPEDYGLSGMQKGITFDRIDYDALGKAMGEELGNCINEKLDGKAEVLFQQDPPGTAGKEDIEKAAQSALEATAPDAKIVATQILTDRQTAQTDVGSALQGNPGLNAVFGGERRGRARCPRRLRRGRQGAPLPDRERRQRRGPAGGQGRQDLRLGGAPVRRRHDPVVRRAGQPDGRPDPGGPADHRPDEGHQGRELIVTMTTPADQPTRAGEPGDGTTADEAVVPTGQDMPRSVSFLVFAAGPRHLRPVGTADRGLRLLVLAVLLQARQRDPHRQRRRPHRAVRGRCRRSAS